MSRVLVSQCTAFFAATVIAWPTCAGAPAIIDLGALPDTTTTVTARGLSEDGTTVVGYCSTLAGNRAFRWNSDTGMVSIGLLSGGDYARAYAVNHDGSAVVGLCNTSVGNVGFVWTSSNGMDALPTLPGASAGTATAFDITPDGQLIVGKTRAANGFEHAVRWGPGIGVQDLGLLPNTVSGFARGISADGQFIAGYCSTQAPVVDQACCWTDSSILNLGKLPGAAWSRAYAISGDGSTITGESGTINWSHAFQWTPSQGMVDLGVLPGGTFSYGIAANANGKIIVGQSGTSAGSHAMAWTPWHGMVDLNEFLPSLGVDLTDWTLTVARAVSPNGSVIVGDGVYQGLPRSWIVTGLPQWKPGDIDLDGAVDINDLLLVINNWGPCPAIGPCPADGDGDSEVSINDLLIVINNWG